MKDESQKGSFRLHFSFFYLERTDAGVAESRETQPRILMDDAAEGWIVGIEALDGSQRAERPLKAVAWPCVVRSTGPAVM